MKLVCAAGHLCTCGDLPLEKSPHYCYNCGFRMHTLCGVEWALMKQQEDEYKVVMDSISPIDPNTKLRPDPKPKGKSGMSEEYCLVCIEAFRALAVQPRSTTSTASSAHTAASASAMNSSSAPRAATGAVIDMTSTATATATKKRRLNGSEEDTSPSSSSSDDDDDISPTTKKSGNVKKPTLPQKSFASATTTLSRNRSLDKAAAKVNSKLISTKSSTTSTNEEVIDVDADSDDNGGRSNLTLSNPDLIRPLNKTSQWWSEFFQFNPRTCPDKKHKACCRHCGAEISVRQGTGGMSTHLSHHHKEIFLKMTGQAPDSDDEAPAKTAKKSSGASDASSSLITRFYSAKPKEKEVAQLKKEYTRAAVSWVITELQPFTAVEKASFRQMFSVFHSKSNDVVNVTAKTVREEVQKLGNLARKATKLILKTFPVSWTTDHWTGVDDLTYTTTTIQYIDDWQLKRSVVDFKVFEGSTTGELIFEDQAKVFEDFNAKPMIVLGVTDSAANMGKFGEILRELGLAHAFCTDHILHLNAMIVFNGAGPVMAKARKIVEYFSKSTQKTSLLLKLQENSDLVVYVDKVPKKILQDVVTRWWSTYRMTKRLLFLRPALEMLHVSEQIDCERFSTEEWKILGQIEILLQEMSKWQQILEGDKYVTASLVLPAIYSIRKHYNTVLNSEHTDQQVKVLALKLLEDLDKRFEPPTDDMYKDRVSFSSTVRVGHRKRYVSVHPIFFVASFLDPRTKKKLKHMMVPTELEELKNYVLELMIEKAKQKLQGGEADTPGEQQETPRHQQRTQVSFGFGLFDASDDDEENLNAGNGTSDDEIMQICSAELTYFVHAAGIPLMKGKGEFSDPLEWWKENQTSFKWLAELAKEYLSPPATSAPSERVWSRAARLLTAKRSRLKSEVTSDMMFVHENLHVLYDKWEQIEKNVPLNEAYLPPLDKSMNLKYLDWQDLCSDDNEEEN